MVLKASDNGSNQMLMRIPILFRFFFVFCFAFGALLARNASAQGGGAGSADLTSLTLNAGTLAPAFASATTNYAASVANPVTSITVTAISFGGSATIQVRINGGTFANVPSGSPSGALPLNVGANSIDVRVTSGNGSTNKTYYVTVMRNLSQPDVQTLAAGGSGTTATLNGVVNPQGGQTSAWFEWGTTTNYGNATPAQPLGSGSTDTNFSQTLTGLNIGDAYHYRAVASNSLGVAFGTNQSFLLPAFTNITTSFLGLEKSAVAWGDYDNDGRLDLLMSGYSLGIAISQVWRNTGGGFTNLNAILTGAQFSSAAWCDYDNDGGLDFLLTGFDSQVAAIITRFYRNTGNGFTNLNSGLPTISATMDWGDSDRDGRSDLLLGGGNFITNVSPVWRNVSALYAGVPFVDANTGLPRLNGISSSVKWGDMNGDGWLDALVAGVSNSTNTTQLWRNYRGSFSNLNSGLPALRYASVAWGDYDNDGRPDIFLTGTTNTGVVDSISQIWRNTGNGFTNLNAGLPGVALGSVAWGDYDNDGRLDIVLCGTTNGSSSGAICQLWRNATNGFTLVNAEFPGILYGSVAWGDYNNDGRLDLALVGESPTAGSVAQVWVNQVPAINTPPTPPDGLHAVVEDNSVVLKWSPSTDAETPSSGLTYNVRIGTTPGGSDVVAPMSDATGLRRLPQPGNARQSLRWPADNLPLDRVLYWSVQAVDTAFAGSVFSAGSTFKLLYAPPALVPPDATVPTLGDTNGDGVLNESEKNLVLANYFANSPWLLMRNVAGLAGTNVDFSLTNNLSGTFSVEYSTNFTDWYLLGPAIPRYFFTDTNAPVQPQRYYRLRWP